MSKAKRDIHRKLRILNHAKKIDLPLLFVLLFKFEFRLFEPAPYSVPTGFKKIR